MEHSNDALQNFKTSKMYRDAEYKTIFTTKDKKITAYVEGEERFKLWKIFEST